MKRSSSSSQPHTIWGVSDEVAQVIITISDEDFAFPVLLKMCRMNKWRMMDPESGQSYG